MLLSPEKSEPVSRMLGTDTAKNILHAKQYNSRFIFTKSHFFGTINRMFSIRFFSA